MRQLKIWYTITRKGDAMNEILDQQSVSNQYEKILFSIAFLIGTFLIKSAQLLQWLVFFLFFFVRPETTHGMYHFLYTVYFYQKYLLLNFERILSF